MTLQTHQLQYLPYVDTLLLLNNDGSVQGCGTYDELLTSGVLKPNTFVKEEEVAEEPPEDPQVGKKRKDRRESDGRLVKAEDRQKGLVKFSTYKVESYSNHGFDSNDEFFMLFSELLVCG